MPSSFLTDDTVWRLVCARQLDELDPTRADSREHDEIALRLQADPRLGLLSATEAAKAFHVRLHEEGPHEALVGLQPT